MINIILFILLITIAILLIVHILFYNKYNSNSKSLNYYRGGGSGSCTLCECEEYVDTGEGYCRTCEHSFDVHTLIGDDQIDSEWNRILDDELLIPNNTTLSPQILEYINSFSSNEFLRFFDIIFEKYSKIDNLGRIRLLKIISKIFANSKFKKILLSDDGINIIKNKLTNPQLGGLYALFKKEYIINANNQYGTIYKLYDVIEINFNNSEDLVLKQSIHSKIIEYIQTLISEDTKKHSPSTEFLLYGDNRDDRDKLLNNLALLVVGITSTEYVCILLYPVLFKAFREFKENVEKINFGSSQVYAQPNESGIFDSEGSNKFISRKGIFRGGGDGHCTICSCDGYEDSGDNFCLKCEHDFDVHIDETDVAESEVLAAEVPAAEVPEVPAATAVPPESGKDKLKKALKMANSDYKQARLIEESKFKEFIIQILNSRLNCNIPFFYVPTKVKFTKEWRPMLIKPLNNTNTDFMDIYYRGQARTFFVDCHGAYSYGLNNTLKTIDLYDNEIVVMSCATCECASRFPYAMTFFCCSSQYYRDMFIDFVLGDSTKLNRPFLKRFESNQTSLNGVQIPYRNNYCVYTKRCPNLSFYFYNHNPNTLYEEIPCPVYEFPTQFRSRTIGDLIATLPDPSILGPITQDIKDLSISNAPYDNIPGITQFLGNTIENTSFLSSIYCNNIKFYHSTKMNDASVPSYIQSWLSTNKIRMNCLLDKFDKDLGQPKEKREIQTYYTHINPKKQETGTLFDEITKIREYYTKIDPNQKIIYFVNSCRA